MDKYESKTIEEKWQRVWADARAFSVSNDDLTDRALKSYVLEMLPYPSGTLHMGHVLVYTIGDVLTHYRRRSGLRVLRPMGYDSFGLPAENAAINGARHPREITERSTQHIRRTSKRCRAASPWD